MSTRPANWKYLAPHPPKGTVMFAGQEGLPKLPVPELPATFSRLKESLKPLARSDEELETAVKKIDEFAHGQASVLQSRLLQKKDETVHWMEDWWDDLAYMGYRDSVVINVSYYYGFDDVPAHLSGSPVSRAAGITRAAMLFRQRVKQGLLKPDATKEGPFCMDTWRWMFDCCRVPGVPHDWSVTHSKEGDLGDSGHVIALRKGRVWKVDVTHAGNILSTGELEKQFQYIYENTQHEYPGVGVLTASNRDVWAKDYVELISDTTNASVVDAIHSAAFVICLDTEHPADPVAHSHALWHGAVTKSVDGVQLGLRNRWVDKPIQFIVFDNGKAGMMGEHSVMDGTPSSRMCDEVLDNLYHPNFDHGSPAASSLSPPTPLDFKVTPVIEEAIESASKAALELIETQSLTFHLTSYGKEAIKAFGVSPDFWAQMIIQLAYLRLIGFDNNKRTGGTYEAATTRKFFKGRTECIRVVTSQSDKFAWSMDNEDVSEDDKRRYFMEAMKKHIQLAKTAGNGEGVDRHLLGMKLALQDGEPVPALYSDPLYLRSGHWTLSTSAIFSKHFPVYGWGEVVADGFGVAYMTGYDDRLQFTVTSRKEMPNQQFIEGIAKAAVDIYNLHAHASKARL
ncbi:hypothetical protein JAAARDRAFT_123269 [Jaapia argillacea MUCL 33604]|uniref:Choline/carnitine acyltransferase domain-containing protein n=1 Tax=Jaapia argillacea MUCL 33604 TaxID=933084 RepID=A0A067QD16_9AGAM|nr:hypothetical protein JAAARDRAFT_123269 [Jaapia argillacea MUCL 33604]